MSETQKLIQAIIKWCNGMTIEDISSKLQILSDAMDGIPTCYHSDMLKAAFGFKEKE